MSEKFRKVTEAEFAAFIESYPRPLIRHVCRIIEPEQAQFCDPDLGVWPEFVVAYYSLWGCDPKDIWANVPGNWHVLADGYEDPRWTITDAGREALGKGK